MVFRGKMCGKVFYAKNNFGIAHFSLFVIDAWKYIYNAIIFIQAAFIHKTKVFVKNFIREISNMLLILYFSHIFTLSAALEKISRNTFFFVINVYCYLTVPFCLKHNNGLWSRWYICQFYDTEYVKKIYNDFHILTPISIYCTSKFLSVHTLFIYM